MAFLKAALGALATAYMNDAVLKPRSTGKLARGYCNRVGKPLLLVHGERVVDHLIGAPVQADVTTRRAYPLRVPDKTFGAVVAVNVLECLRRPDLALREWRRVADKVFAVVPSWWSPAAWLDPSIRWLVDPRLKRVVPLWTRQRSIYLLPVSDNGYGTRRWSPTNTSLPPRSPPSPSPMYSETSSDRLPSSSLDPTPDPSQSQSPLPEPQPSSEASPQSPSEPETSSMPAMLPDLPDLDELTSSDPQQSDLGIEHSSSRSSARVLTVVSTPTSDGG